MSHNAQSLALNNPSSSICAAHIYMGVGPSPGAWLTNQEHLSNSQHQLSASLQLRVGVAELLCLQDLCWNVDRLDLVRLLLIDSFSPRVCCGRRYGNVPCKVSYRHVWHLARCRGCRHDQSHHQIVLSSCSPNNTNQKSPGTQALYESNWIH